MKICILSGAFHLPYFGNHHDTLIVVGQDINYVSILDKLTWIIVVGQDTKAKLVKFRSHVVPDRVILDTNSLLKFVQILKPVL